MISDRSSLVGQFALLLALAAFVGAVLYLSFFFGGRALMEGYIENASYAEREAAKRIGRFQSFVSENDVSAHDAEAISAWAKTDSVVLMEVYRGRHMLYSSAAPEYFYELESAEEGVLHDWTTYHTVVFADGAAQVVVFADDVSKRGFWLIFASAAAAVAGALAVILIGCKRIVGQICTLNDRVRRMEEGDLDGAIPALGSHELGQLAQSLDSMRCAFREQVDREKAVLQAHQTMVTEMSHDLRTPLTTLQIYTDVLRQRRHDPAMLDSYLELIDAKARQIKQLADNIFEYSLTSEQRAIELEPPAPVRKVLYDPLSEHALQWSRQGFDVVFEPDWPDACIAVHPPYVKRVMDNISSNLTRYASKGQPVLMKAYVEQGCFCVSIRNEAAIDGDGSGTRIGLSNVEAMMKRMNGDCRVKKAGEEFSVTLVFPLANEVEGETAD